MRKQALQLLKQWCGHTWLDGDRIKMFIPDCIRSEINLRFPSMKTNTRSQSTSNLPVSKQTTGAVAGAVLGSVVAGPLGAAVGAVAGTIMGNRAARGELLITPSTRKTAKAAVKAIQKKMPSVKTTLMRTKTATKSPKPTARKTAVRKVSKAPPRPSIKKRIRS